MSPTISIITVAYNAEQHIAQTIESVVSQSYGDYEYIVIDGSSTDSTMDIVRERAGGIDHIVSEPDAGIGDAMNKGLRLAAGEYVLFLHADDYLLGPDVLAEVAPLLSAPIEAFRLVYDLEDGGQRLPRIPSLGWRTNFKTGLDHQAVLCRASLLRDLDGFDTSLRIAMDYDLFLRAYRRGVSAQIHDLPISVMRKTGISSRSDRASLLERFREEKKIHERHASNLGWRAVYWAYWIAYPIYRGFNPWRDFRS